MEALVMITMTHTIDQTKTFRCQSDGIGMVFVTTATRTLYGIVIGPVRPFAHSALRSRTKRIVRLPVNSHARHSRDRTRQDEEMMMSRTALFHEAETPEVNIGIYQAVLVDLPSFVDTPKGVLESPERNSLYTIGVVGSTVLTI